MASNAAETSMETPVVGGSMPPLVDGSEQVAKVVVANVYAGGSSAFRQSSARGNTS